MSNLRPNLTITDDVKVTFGRDNYSRRLDCPTCDTTGRHDGTVCGRCSGAGFVWAKPAKPTEAEIAAADAKLAEEAEKAAKHRADGEAIRTAARERRAALTASNDAILSEEAEKAVAEFAATLDDLTAEKVDSPRVYALRQAEKTGRADLVVIPCDSCFGTPSRVADCFRCEGVGLVWLNASALEAKAARVEERRNRPATDPADIEDDAPTEDRARIWDEAASAYRRAFRLTAGFPLDNPYRADPAE